MYLLLARLLAAAAQALICGLCLLGHVLCDGAPSRGKVCPLQVHASCIAAHAAAHQLPPLLLPQDQAHCRGNRQGVCAYQARTQAGRSVHSVAVTCPKRSKMNGIIIQL